MNIHVLTVWAVIVMPTLALAQVADPVAHFKAGLTVASEDRILKWECDINGDAKNEVLLTLKSDFDNDMANHEPPSWELYIANSDDTYHPSEGVELAPNSISDVLPNIDPTAFFVGQIDELGKRGIVTMRINNPRESESVGKIYAYTIDGDHLKRTELAQYLIVEGPHLLFTMYLADDKRVHVQFEELTP